MNAQQVMYVVVDGGFGREYSFATRAEAICKLMALKPITCRLALLRIEERVAGWR